MIDKTAKPPATMESMRFTAEQSAKLKFPIGCPVWYNLPSTDDAEAVEGAPWTTSSPNPKRGVVQSALWRDNKLFYEVAYACKDSVIITEEVEDGKLGFGASCPVRISPVSAEDSSRASLEGEIVLCTPSTTSPNEFVYTAMVFLDDGTPTVRYEGSIEENRVSYKVVEVESGKEGKEKEKNTSAAVGTVGKSADDNDGTVLPCQLTAVVPNVSNSPSKEKEYGNASTMNWWGSHDDEEGEVIEEPRRSLPPPSVAYSNSNTSREKASDETITSSKMEIIVPLWLQKDRSSQRNLFFHIIGVNGCNTKRIEYEAGCKVHIVRSGEGDAPFVPMKIYVEAMHANQALRDLKVARHLIQSIVLEYVGNDGCRGRLLYEVAKSCWGSHRPKQSTSRAVLDFNPFQHSGQQIFMSVVELPFLCEEGGKVFHAAHSVLMRGNLDKVQAAGCFVMVAQKGFRVPSEICDPYVFVYGKTYRSVDQAVHIVKYVIRRHQKNCSCTY